MKKINKIFSITVLFSALAIVFSACQHPALYELNRDVVSEASKVSGSINSIARYTVSGQEYLVLAGGEEETATTGLLYKKVESDLAAESNAHGQWKLYPKEKLPFDLHSYDYYNSQSHLGEQIIKVLAGSEYLYVLTTTYKNNSTLGTNCPDKVSLWAVKITDWDTSSKEDWTNIIEGDKANRSDGIPYFPFYDTSRATYSAFSIFSTNAPIASSREVFIRSGDITNYKTKYYKVDGLTITEIPNINFLAPSTAADGSRVLVTETTSESSKNLVNSVVKVNGENIFFSSSMGVTTNETYTTPGTIYYATLDNYVVYGTSYLDAKKTVNAGSSIASLAYCKDALLIGCGNFYSTTATSDAGVKKVNLTNDIPGDVLVSFTTNAQSQLLSSYIVMTLLNATPDKTELDSTLYASLTFIGTASSTQSTFKNIGLWSYYANRGNWNKE